MCIIGAGAFVNTAYYNNADNWTDGVLYISNHLVCYNDTIAQNYSIADGTITIAEYAFSSCSQLHEITFPDSIRNIGKYSFYNCQNITNVVIPDSVEYIGESAFEKCTSLANITLPDASMTIIYGAFYNTGYYNDSGNWDNGNEALYIDKHLIHVNSSLTGEYLVKEGTITIAHSSFYGCRIYSVVIPSSVMSINLEAFWSCSYLENISYKGTVSGWNSIHLGSNWNYGVPATYITCNDGTAKITLD